MDPELMETICLCPHCSQGCDFCGGTGYVPCEYLPDEQRVTYLDQRGTVQVTIEAKEGE